MGRSLGTGRILLSVALAGVCGLVFGLPGPVSGEGGFPAFLKHQDPGGGKSCLVTGRPIHDFKLRDIVSGRMVTFLDIWQRDYTFIAYLGKPTPQCLDNLSTLERLRDRFHNRITLVAVFADPVDETEILRFLIQSQVYPDFALHDPALHQLQCYGFEKTPALLVTGPSGNIILRVTCSSPVDVTALAARLENVLALGTLPAGTCPEVRRIYAEAMAWEREGSHEMAALYLERVLELRPNFYTVNRLIADLYRELDRDREAAIYYSRYLGADMYAYDLQEVRQRIRSLAGSGR